MQEKASFSKCTGLLAASPSMNVATLHTSKQSAEASWVHLFSWPVCLQPVLLQSSIHSALTWRFKNGWEIDCYWQNGGGDCRMVCSHQWKLIALLHPTLCLITISCGWKADGCGGSYGCRKLGVFCSSLCSKCSGQTCNNAVPAVFDVDEEPEVTSLETDDEDD